MQTIIGTKKVLFPRFGTLNSILSFPSEFAPGRRVDIWLPDHYDPRSEYAVLYMHDGQNLFNPAVGFHGMIWAVDQALQPLIDKNKVRPTIVVGIWNTSLRYQEYLPAPAFNLLSDTLREMMREEHNNPGLQPLSDNYLKFITSELKPFIDGMFPTLQDAGNTFIMGSSMGGLISSYALACYPEIFGGAGCVSTHWPLSLHSNELDFSTPYINWLAEKLPSPAHGHRLYFDYGTETIDEFYEVHQQMMDEKLRQLGWTEGQNWVTLKDEGAPHSETAWRNRVHLPLEFLLG
ncbi:MAG TPA: alpha/beta hydrolase-fold protein [Bacteroidales bacterium]|nr:alpha/beta hydrolase-fold protein [Bacteroidales bacterium]